MTSLVAGLVNAGENVCLLYVRVRIGGSDGVFRALRMSGRTTASYGFKVKLLGISVGSFEQ